MRRLLLMLVAISLCGTAAATELLQASTIQQSTLQLRSDVAALRTALSRAGVNPQTTLTAYAPALLDRARAASAQSAEFQKRIQVSLAAADYKRKAAEVDYALQNLKDAIQQMASMVQAVSDAARKLEEVAQKIEQVLPKLEALVAGDPGATTQACTLPHASTTVVNRV